MHNAMKIIDFHQHCMLPMLKIKEIMDRNNIEKSIQIPFDSGNFTWEEMAVQAGMGSKTERFHREILNHLITINEAYYSIFGKDPRFEFVPWISITHFPTVLEQYEWFRNSRILKFIPVFDESGDTYWIKLGKFIENVKQKAIMIHTGWESSPVYYNNLIGNHPEKIFILAHMKEDDDSDNTERKAILRDYDNAYLEMSYISSPKRLAQYVNMGFEDKILFGSDFRTMDDEQSLKWFINAVQIANISDSAKEKILHGNAEMLMYRLSKNILL